MDTKNKDCVFSIALVMLGGYVLYEGWAMAERATRAPYNIQLFRISPGMLPIILGCLLVFFSLLLLFNALKGEGRPASSLVRHLRASSMRFGRALGEVDVRSMIVSVVIMAVYTFGLLGEVPFWIGAMIFLVALMLFLRAGKIWVVLASSGLSVLAMVLLFEHFFKTTLP